MPMSESEKHQGNVRVCHSNDKLEHLPLKKRRFLYRTRRSPSPPPQIPSPVNEESSNFSKSQDDPFQSLVTCSVSCKSELGTLAVDKAVVQGNIKSVEDFSGMSLLAAAAASSSCLGRGFGYAEDNSGVEEPSVNVEVSTNSEAHSFSKGLVKEESVNKPEISCVTTGIAGELASISTDCTSAKVESLETSIKDPFHEDSKPTVSSDVSSMKDEDIDGSQKLQYRDDRLHWDLNVVMDAWDQPDYQNSHISDSVSQGSGIAVGCAVNKNSAENHDLLNEPESSMCDDKKNLLHYEPGKSLDQISQGNQVDDVNHKNQIVSMCNLSMSSEYKNVPSSLGDGNSSAQPLVSKYKNETAPILNPFDIEKNADSKPTGESINFSPLFRDKKNLSVPDRNCSLVSVGAAVTKNTGVSVIDTQVKSTVWPTLDIEDESTPKSMMSDKPFDDKRQILKNDNDSQYEDGELVLEEYDAANEKTEHINDVFDKSSIVTATDHHYSEPGQIRRINHRNACNTAIISSAGETSNELCPKSDKPITDDNAYGKDDTLLKLVHSRDEKMEGPGSSEIFESYNLADRRTGYRRGFRSQSNGPVGHDMFIREDQAGNRSKPGYNHIKYPESASYSRQSQPRVHIANNCNGSSNAHRGFKRNYSPTYHTLVNTVDEDDTERKEDRDGTLNTASYLSHDESIADVGVAGNFQPNRTRNCGPDRLMNRGRFIRYDRQMDNGAGRGRFHRRPPSQREKSFSPNGRRGYQFVHQSHSRSPSRSRTRSPDSRGSPYIRHSSRSPNFRPEARMTRMRSPPHQQRFRPVQRDHGSPPASRWIGNRKDEPGHFNYKHNSPNSGRFSDSARNPKPDVYYRQNTGRFSEMEGNGRPNRFEENFENRRRQFGIANRLCRDNDDGFVSRNRDVAEFHGRGNNSARDIDNRNEDMPRRFKRDGAYMYERDGKFGSKPKQFGFARMDSSRNMESGEPPYRSMYPGRYNNEMNGRRQYNDVYLPRRGGDFDDNLPIPRSSCDDDASDSRMDDLAIRQREEQQVGLCDQEKELGGEASESIDVEVPAEK